MSDNALDRASFYVEELKYGPGPRALEPLVEEELAAQLDVLLAGSGVTSITGRELAEACDFYAQSWGRIFEMKTVVAKSLFVDGLMHGIALAGGLESTRERLTALEKEGRE